MKWLIFIALVMAVYWCAWAEQYGEAFGFCAMTLAYMMLVQAFVGWGNENDS